MKKIILILLINLIYIVNSNAQNDISIGYVRYSNNSERVTSYGGFTFAVTGNNLYLDISTNHTPDKSFDILKNPTLLNDIPSNRMNVSSINVGYSFSLDNEIKLIPTIGLTDRNEVFKNLDDKYYIKGVKYLNVGIIGKKYFNRYGIYAGFGTIERYKFGFSYKLPYIKY
jgi:hypothetical protein